MNRVEKALSRATDTKMLKIGEGVLPKVAHVFETMFPGCEAVVIADRTTFALAGKAVVELLDAAGIKQHAPYLFDEAGLYAEWSYVEQLDRFLATTSAVPIAVGSGTINDLTKLSSFRNNRGYMTVATAASMDGYTAFGASITFEGAKQTFSCPAPRAVVADTSIIAAAPAQMTASGYADLFAKVPAGADWILADALGVEPIDEFAFSVVQEGLHDALSNPEGARRGEMSAIEPLIEGLLLGGFAMQAHKSSRPASGADHQFSHLWDMEHHKMGNGVAPSHGFKVSIGMLMSTALYEQLLQSDIEHLDIEACVAAWASKEDAERYALDLFRGTDFPTIGVTETDAKYSTPDELRRQLTLLKQNWSEIKSRLQSQIVPFDEARRRLALVGAPVEPEQIGITRSRLRSSAIRAQHIRRRFTILDVAVRCGLLDKWLDSLFGRGGIWEITE